MCHENPDVDQMHDYKKQKVKTLKQVKKNL